MFVRARDDEGFGLIEAIIAMVLLAVIAMALAPMLWNGIRYSSEEASVATATRGVNSTVEKARDEMRSVSTATGCLAVVAAATGAQQVRNGLEQDITISGTVVTGACTPGTSITIRLKAEQNARTLATATAIIFVPPPAMDLT